MLTELLNSNIKILAQLENIKKTSEEVYINIIKLIHSGYVSIMEKQMDDFITSALDSNCVFQKQKIPKSKAVEFCKQARIFYHYSNTYYFIYTRDLYFSGIISVGENNYIYNRTLQTTPNEVISIMNIVRKTMGRYSNDF